MNVTPGGDPQTPVARSIVFPELVQTPTSASFQSFNTTPRLNSISSSNTVSDINRVYENLDTAEMRPLLSRAPRCSKPDLFAKPLEQTTTATPQSLPADKSEPSTPTIHYIVLDLDHTSSASHHPTVTSPTTASNPPSVTLTTGGPPPTPVPPLTIHLSTQLPTSPSLPSIGSISPSSTTMAAPLSPLPPDSPKHGGVMDYAKIDFNKTVALSNSANPSSELDSEESRKTRHSSVAKTPTISAAD